MNQTRRFILVGIIFTLTISSICLVSAQEQKSEQPAFDKEHLRLAEELLALLRAKEMIEAKYKAIEEQTKAGIEALLNTVDTSSEELNKRVSDGQLQLKITKEAMEWEGVKNKYVNIYAKFFTKNELSELIKVYKKPIMMKWVERSEKMSGEIRAVNMKRLYDMQLKYNDDFYPMPGVPLQVESDE